MSGITTSDIREAWGYAELAYTDHARLRALLGESLTIIDRGREEFGDACCIIRHGDRVILAFPGSDDIADWVLNVDDKVRDGFHDGFCRGLDEMADDILTCVAQRPARSLLITGHSRGGALADLMLERYLRSLLPLEIDCITFAQPRIATAAYYAQRPPVKDSPGVRYLRVAMANDGVPHLPLSRSGYVHHGPELILGQLLTARQRFARWLRGLPRTRTPLAIEEHGVEVYRAAVNGMR